MNSKLDNWLPLVRSLGQIAADTKDFPGDLVIHVQALIIQIATEHPQLVPMLWNTDVMVFEDKDPYKVRIQYDIFNASIREEAELHWETWIPQGFFKCIKDADQVSLVSGYLTEIHNRQKKWDKRPNKGHFIAV